MRIRLRHTVKPLSEVASKTERKTTWYSICNVSRCTPMNLALTSKTPTASDGEISKITFLNLKREEEHEIGKDSKPPWFQPKTVPQLWVLAQSVSRTHWLGCRSSMAISTPFSWSREAVYFWETCLLFLALLLPGFCDNLRRNTLADMEHFDEKLKNYWWWIFLAFNPSFTHQ